MPKPAYYKQDWFIALFVGLVFGVAILAHSHWLTRFELMAYDLGVRATHRTPGAAEQIAVVSIDDASIAELGRWPWPRRLIADALERLTKAKARAVGLLLDLSEPQLDGGLVALRDIRDQLDGMTVPKAARATLNSVRTLLNRAERELDGDRLLALAMRSTPRLHLPVYLERGKAEADTTPPPEYLQRYRIGRSAAAESPVDARAAARLRAPLEHFARYARGVGQLSLQLDPDGGVRALHTALEFDGHHYPSLLLLLAASQHRLDVRHIEYAFGKGVSFGRLFVPTDAAGRTYTGFYEPPPGQEQAFAVYSFRDLLRDKVQPSVFTNKIVLIGVTAGDSGARFRTPTQDVIIPEPLVAANMIAGILNQDFYVTPEWAPWAQLGALVFFLLYLMFVMPRMSGNIATLVSLLLLIGLLGAEQFLMVTQKLWVPAVAPALLLVVAHLAIASKRFVLGERGKSESDSAHTNRMLGLAFQSQGQLDMAMDKFRKLPVDDSVLDLIYSLALDFERKRQFHKAAAAYDYILDHRANFRDCVERKKRASHGDQTIALGKTMILDGAEKPTLGRYHIEKEIGRGEMGIVYLGLDPKINRRVAIKTIALSQEFHAKELEDARERFFREAETAGRLHHPNIVTIYDVGEEHDLAYIAMEYLDGKELAAYIEPDKPLPFDWILEVAIKVADALAYAHRNDVVHRDIKPHNIVYDEATGSVKVTDFGIARITAASRTKTGLVLGTPSYMSPEQIAGKRVDGRSDLYSLGAMLFELVTGDVPFDGDSFAALTHQIINAPVPDIRKHRADTPPALVTIIKRLLQKQVTKRYQTGEELKQALEQCRDTLGERAKA